MKTVLNDRLASISALPVRCSLFHFMVSYSYIPSALEFCVRLVKLVFREVLAKDNILGGGGGGGDGDGGGGTIPNAALSLLEWFCIKVQQGETFSWFMTSEGQSDITVSITTTFEGKGQPKQTRTTARLLYRLAPHR